MVALNTAYAPNKTLERSQNRVGYFFCEGTDRFGTNRLPTRNRTGENATTVTIIVSGRPSFISRDPIGLSGGDVNFYAYVLNNSVNYWDPLGLRWFGGGDDENGWTVGRDDSIVPPGGIIGGSLESYVPAMETMSEIHDSWVGDLTAAGVPDAVANIPTMPLAYSVAVSTELSRSAIEIVTSPFKRIGDYFNNRNSEPKNPKPRDEH